MPPTARRQLAIGDLVVMLMLGIGAPLAGILPHAAIRKSSKVLSNVIPVSFRQEAKAHLMSKAFGISETEAESIQRRQLEARLISMTMLLREIVLKKGLELEIEGRENISNALAANRGVVIWLGDFVYSGDAIRQAFHKLGYPLSHMSRPEHGFSDSVFGVRYLNPFRLRSENRYLRRRFVFDRDKPIAVLTEMSAALKKNEAVSLLACAYEGKTLAEVPFMNGVTQFAVGAPRLAFKAKCPILPVFAVPKPDVPRFRVVIGKPLRMHSSRRDEAVLEAATDYAARLEGHVRSFPHLWRGWSQTSLPKRSSSVAAVNERTAEEA
jgi:lauroyl/myristoyl acyltransferase